MQTNSPLIGALDVYISLLYYRKKTRIFKITQFYNVQYQCILYSIKCYNNGGLYIPAAYRDIRCIQSGIMCSHIHTHTHTPHIDPMEPRYSYYGLRYKVLVLLLFLLFFY